MNILITGASRGIGLATYELLKSRGHNVIGHSTRGDGGLIAGDLMAPDAPRRIWTGAVEQLGGRIDVMINNAGIFEGISEDASDADWHTAWERTLRVNLEASADFCRLAINHFRERGGGGRIVNVASRAAWRGDSPQHWHYAASKGAITAMTKTIARAYAAEEVFAFCVSPGFTMTGMADDYMATRGTGVAADIPLGRVATTDEVAETIRWLATEAPPSATGTNVDVNGASYVR
jgi:NAD(P)-dependent dehydrogenase (short-subunit alcohol dehydrogenase family)